MLDDYRRVDGIVDGLAHQLIVERLMGNVHGEKIHSHPFNFFGPYPGVILEARQLFDRHVVGEVALTGEKASHPTRIFLHPSNDDLLDRRLAAPVTIVTSQYEIAVPLPTDEAIGTGTHRLQLGRVATLRFHG